MKKIAIIMTILFLTASCTASRHYGEYVDAQVEVSKAKPKPIVDLEFVDSGGKPIKLVVHLPKKPIKIEQVRVNEWVGTVTAGIKSFFGVIGLGIIADSAVKIFKSAGNHSVTNTTTTTSSTSNSVSDTDGVVTIGDTNDVDFQPDNSAIDNTVNN